MMDRLASLQLSRIALPEMSSEALWNKKAIKVTWVPQNALYIIYIHRGNTQTWISWRKLTRALRLGQYQSDLTHSYHILPQRFIFTMQLHKPYMIHLQIFSGDRRTWLTGSGSLRGSSSDGSSTVAAVTQRCQLFCSDSLQMPPGPEAKINICGVTGRQ